MKLNSYQELSSNVPRKNNVYYCNIWCIWYVEMLIKYIKNFNNTKSLNEKILSIINTEEKAYNVIINYSSKVSILYYQFLKYIYSKYSNIFLKYNINTYTQFLKKNIIKIKLLLSKHKIKINNERIKFQKKIII